MSVSPRSRATLLAMVRATPSPTRQVVRRRTVLLLGGAAAVAASICAAAFLLLERSALQPPAALSFATSTGSAVLAGLALWIAVGRGNSALGRPRPLLLALLAIVPLLFAWKFGWASALSSVQADPSHSGFRCLELSLAMASPALAALLWLRRGSDPSHPASAGLAFGIATGAAAWVALDVWCPIGEFSHLLLGHLLPLLILALAGALLGARVLAVRDRRS